MTDAADNHDRHPGPNSPDNAEAEPKRREWGNVAAWVAAAIAAISAGISGIAAYRAHQETEKIQGTTACIAYRNEVIALHDRGMVPAQIRRLLGEEEGAYLRPELLKIEEDCGLINDLVETVPRKRSGARSSPRAPRPTASPGRPRCARSREAQPLGARLGHSRRRARTTG